jgi:hypothetical protein
LTERHPRLRGEDLDPIERDLTLYAEHTFGHAAAMSRPWHPLVQGISTRKRAYAAAAQESLCVLRERAIERLGGGAIRPGRPLRYKLINTLPREADDVVRLPVSHFELHELRLDRGARAIDAATDERLASQRADAPGLAEFCVPIRLEAGGERVLELQAVDEGATQAATRRVSAIETPQVRIGRMLPSRWFTRRRRSPAAIVSARYAVRCCSTGRGPMRNAAQRDSCGESCWTTATCFARRF